VRTRPQSGACRRSTTRSSDRVATAPRVDQHQPAGREARVGEPALQERQPAVDDLVDRVRVAGLRRAGAVLGKRHDRDLGRRRASGEGGRERRQIGVAVDRDRGVVECGRDAERCRARAAPSGRRRAAVASAAQRELRPVEPVQRGQRVARRRVARRRKHGPDLIRRGRARPQAVDDPDRLAGAVGERQRDPIIAAGGHPDPEGRGAGGVERRAGPRDRERHRAGR